MKKYRFFYHYNKPHKLLSVHFRNKCIMGADVACCVPTSSKWNRRQPFVVMQGWAENVYLNKDGVIVIE